MITSNHYYSLIFKNIETEGNTFVQNLKSIFLNGFNGIFASLKTQDFSFTNTFSTSLKQDRAALLAYREAINNNVPATEAFEQTMTGASVAAQEFAKNNEVNILGIQNFTKAQKVSAVEMMAQNKSFANCKTLINEYSNGCKNCGLSQEQFAAAVGKSNPALAKYLSGLNGSKASLTGYIGSLISAKAATIGLELATMALNSAVSFGFSFLFSKAIEVVSEHIRTVKEIAESAEEAISAYQEAQSTLKSNKQTINEISSDYERLAKGVDNFGNNISLSTSEYERYNEIVNQIADMFPDLVKGYTDEGNAIIATKGNVEELTEAYEKQVKAYRDSLLFKENDIFKTFKNNTEGGFWGGLLIGTESSPAKQIEAIEKALDQSVSESDYYFSNLGGYLDDALKGAGIEFSAFDSLDALLEKSRNNESKLKKYLNSLKSTMEAEVVNIKPVMEAYLEDNENIEYQKLSPDAKNAVKSIVSQLDYEFYQQFDSMAEAESSVMENIVKPLQEASLSNEITLVFNAQTKLNDGDITIGEYQNQIDSLLKSISGLDTETQTYVKLALGIDEKGIDQDKNNFENVVQQFIDDGIDKAFGNGVSREFVGKLKLPEFEAMLKNGGDFRSSISDWLKKNQGATIGEFENWFTSILSESANSLDGSTSKIISAFNAATNAVDLFKKELESTKSGTEAFEGYAETYKTAMDLINKGYDLDNGKLFSAAEFLLGADTLEKYGYDVDKVKTALKQLKVVFGDVDTMGGGFQNRLKQIVDKNGELKNSAGEVIATYKSNKWNIDNDHLGEVASKMGMTKEALAACIQATSTWSDVTLEDMDDILAKAKEVGAVYSEQYQGKNIVNVATLRTELESSGEYTAKQIFDIIKQVKDNKNVITIDIKADSSTSSIIDQLSKIGVVSGNEKNGFTGSLEDIVKKLKDTGSSVTDTYDIIKKLFNSDKFKFSDLIDTDLNETELKNKIQSLFSFIGDKTKEDYKVTISVETDGGSVEKTVINLDKVRNDCEIVGLSAEETKARIDILTSGENVITISTDSTEIDNTLESLKQLGLATQEGKTITINVQGVVETSKQIGLTSDQAKDLLDKLSNVNNTKLNGNITQSIDSVYEQTDELSDGVQGVITGVGDLNKTSLSNLKSQFDQATVKVNNLASATQNAINKMNSLNGKTVTTTIRQNVVGSTTTTHSGVNGNFADGTAHTNGIAFAKGNWGTDGSGVALGGELGQELCVRDGKFFTVGDSGAEFFKYQKGDIIFNADQTRQLLESGKIAHGNRRGRAFVDGTAFASGSTSKKSKSSTSKSNSSSKTTSKSSSKKSSSSNSSSSSAKNTKETLDWIEILISRIERAINKLKKTAESTYKSLKTRSAAASKEISKVNEELSLQQKAYDRYIQEANSVGLSSDLAAKVRDGTIDINEYDSETQELISDYQEWYEKALDCADAIDDLHESLASLYEDNFNNIQTDFDNQLSLLEHLSNTYETGMDKLEAQGRLGSTEYYAAMNDVEKKNLKTLNNELNSLTQSFSDAMASGEIEEYSEAWYAMQQSINDTKEAIDETTLSILENEKAMRELEWSYFDYIQDRISQITQESNFLIDLMSNSNLYEDNGQLNDNGMATMGLRAQNYNVYMAQADQYAQEILKLDEEIAKDPYNTDLIERREELLGLQQDSILAAEDEKQAIVDLVREGINIELQALQDLIDAYTDSLDSAKDLYEYQKKIEEQTTDIANLQKQLSAYENDTSEENRARVQQIKVDLAEAQEKLAETEYDQFVTETKKLLDDLYNEYEEILNERLDNVDALLSDMIDVVNSNAESINDTLIETANSVGYKMTDTMQSIWNGATDTLSGIVSKYGDDFTSQLTSVNSVLNTIQANIAALTAAEDGKANSVVSSTSASTPTSKPTNSFTTNNTTNNNNNHTSATNTTSVKKITVGGKINAKGAKIYDYAGDTSGEKQRFANDPIYIVLAEQKGYLKVRHHKQSSGVTGWFKKADVKAYKTGGLVDYTGLAQLDGTPEKPELVLNSKDTENFLELKDVLRQMAQNELSVVGQSPSVYGINITPNIGNILDVSSKLEELKNNTVSKNNNVTFGDMNINIDHVENYDDFVNQLRQDKKFEKMVQSITVDRLVGGSSLAKNKYKW